MQRAISGKASGWYLSAAFALLVPALSAAKSEIALIEVTANGTRVVSIGGTTAREFTIWSGYGTLMTVGGVSTVPTGSRDFAQWVEGAVVPPRDLPTFVVSFLCEACEPARTDTWRCYGVRYAMGEHGEGGFIQIPASNDEQFPLNVQTIYRGVEGQWFRASPKWEKLIRPVIENARAVPAGVIDEMHDE